MRKVLVIAITLTLAAVMVLGVALPGLAAPDEAASEAGNQPRPRMIRGQAVEPIDYENQQFFTLQAGEREIEIEVNEGTKYYLLTLPRRPVASASPGIALMEPQGQGEVELETKPAMSMRARGIDQAAGLARRPGPENPVLERTQNRELAPSLSPSGLGAGISNNWQNMLKWLRQFGQEATFDDIAVGNRVVVRVVPRNDSFLAKLVLIIQRAPDDRERVVGTVTDIDEGEKTITIEPTAETTAATADTAVVLNYDHQTVFVLRGTPSLEEGMKVLAIYVKTDDGLLAKRVMTRVA